MSPHQFKVQDVLTFLMCMVFLQKFYTYVCVGRRGGGGGGGVKGLAGRFKSQEIECRQAYF